MIKQVIEQLRFFKGKNRIIFVSSCIRHIGSILRDSTILTLKFIRPIRMEANGEISSMDYYYEIPFYIQDYSEVTNHIKKDSLLFDIGAHFGEVTYRFLKQNKGYAYAFEANPHNSEIMKKLMSKEKMDGFKLFEFGLGPAEKKEVMYLSNPLSYEGSIINKKGKKEDITIKRMDSLKFPELKKFRNVFFKIDVEGYEVEVISGMTGLLKDLSKSKKKTRFLIEIKEENSVKKIKKTFEGIFKKVSMKKITHEDYLFDM